MDLEIWQYIALFFAGIIAGFLNVVAGGGSLLTVPLLIFSGIPAPIANGTNRIAILAQNISATITFIKKGYKDLKLSFTLALAGLPGGIIGASLGVEFSGVWFNRSIAIIMIVVMAITLYKPKQKSNLSTDEKNKEIRKKYNLTDKARFITGHFLMFGIGVFGGVFQMGVGFLFPFVLHRIMGIDLVRCNMHKVVVILVYTIAALFIFAAGNAVIWTLGIIIACGNSLGAYIGVKTSIEQGDKFVLLVLNIALSIFIVKLLFFY